MRAQDVERGTRRSEQTSDRPRRAKIPYRMCRHSPGRARRATLFECEGGRRAAPARRRARAGARRRKNKVEEPRCTDRSRRRSVSIDRSSARAARGRVVRATTRGSRVGSLCTYTTLVRRMMRGEGSGQRRRGSGATTRSERAHTGGLVSSPKFSFDSSRRWRRAKSLVCCGFTIWGAPTSAVSRRAPSRPRSVDRGREGILLSTISPRRETLARTRPLSTARRTRRARAPAASE